MNKLSINIDNGQANNDYEFEDDDNTFVNAEIQDNPYNNITIDCQYYTEESFLNRFSKNKKNILP